MRILRVAFSIGMLALTLPRAGQAVITFTQLAENEFVVSHRVKLIGSRGQAMKLVYTKASSLCVAAGYQFFEILDQESQAGSEYETANASIRARFHQAAAEGRLDCAENADSQYVQEATAKLAKMGYDPPSPTAPAATGAIEEGSEEPCTPTGNCSIEQIVAMAKAGLEVEQIQAACAGE